MSTGAAPLAPFSTLSGIPSPSLSVSYGFFLPSPSVSAGVTPPLEDAGTPFASTAPSILPSPSKSIPLDSFASLIPSPSLSKSKLLGIPSPSESQVTEDGVHAAFSIVSNIPSLSSSKSALSKIPSPSLSKSTLRVVIGDTQPFASVYLTVILPPLVPTITSLTFKFGLPTQPVGKVQV